MGEEEENADNKYGKYKRQIIRDRNVKYNDDVCVPLVQITNNRSGHKLAEKKKIANNVKSSMK